MKSKNHTFIAIIIGIIVIGILVVSMMGLSKPMIVLSGSMQPVMMTGDVILISPVEPENIKVSDIIAFKNANSVVTHRVISITDTNEFQTKGDANEDEDGSVVEGSNVIGKVVFVIPYIGYLTDITKDPKIFFFVVIIPSLLIIIDELLLIAKYNNPMKLRKIEKDEKKAARQKAPRIINWALLGVIILTVLILSTVFSLPYIGSSRHIQSTNEYIIENNGLFTSSYTILPASIYGTIQPGNATSLSLNESSISMCPLIVPVFWVDIMAKIHPVIPCLFFIVTSTIIIALISTPMWYKKPKLFKKKKL